MTNKSEKRDPARSDLAPPSIWAVFAPHENPKDPVPRVFASASPTKGVEYMLKPKIKPIVWCDYYGNGSCYRPREHTSPVPFNVHISRDGSFWRYNGEKFKDFEVAKAAAQKDYEKLVWRAFEKS